MNQSERRNFLIQSLLEESREYRGMQIPSDSTGQRQLLRGLMNVRMVKKSSAEFLNIQDAYLQEETAKKGVTNVDDLTPVQQGLYLWQGDITALRCDAIVNAANSGMTGCYVPNHRCIDNCLINASNKKCRKVTCRITGALTTASIRLRVCSFGCTARR